MYIYYSIYDSCLCGSHLLRGLSYLYKLFLEEDNPDVPYYVVLENNCCFSLQFESLTSSLFETR